MLDLHLMQLKLVLVDLIVDTEQVEEADAIHDNLDDFVDAHE